MECTYWIEADLRLWKREPIRYSQSDNERPAPPSSPAQRAAHCGRISTGEETQKQFNNMLMIAMSMAKSLMDAEYRNGIKDFHVKLFRIDQ